MPTPITSPMTFTYLAEIVMVKIQKFLRTSEGKSLNLDGNWSESELIRACFTFCAETVISTFI